MVSIANLGGTADKTGLLEDERCIVASRRTVSTLENMISDSPETGGRGIR
jgi:hypothetical protein